MQSSMTPTIVGYDVTNTLGVGGFGAVYQAKQTSINRQVAVKIIKSDFANRPDFIRRFEVEAHVIARLEHPHIVPLYDYWRDPNGAYLVMRYLRGGSLRQLLDKQGSIAPNDVSTILNQISSGLDHAHRNNVIHRDIKPGNILLDEDGNAYIADFGIAKDLSLSDAGMTDADGIVGSLDYLSPEQARSEQVTPRTDIYSLGVTVYEMLVGMHPFHESSSVERLYKHINEPLPDIVKLDATIREAVNDVIQTATQKDPANRYQSVLEFAHAFSESVNATDHLATQLTPREYDVLIRIVDGLSNSQIAEELFIAVSTVKVYVKQIYKKLGVRSRVQATIRAHELNLLNLGVGQDIPTLTGNSYLPEPENPYKGLRPFDAADALDFFGREALVQKLLNKMSDNDKMSRFLALVGPSGSGKSSLVRAGLIPAIWNGYIAGSDRWYTLDIVPGSHPMDELEIALARIASKPISELNEYLWRDNRGLLRASKLVLPDDDTELVIVIDQFEEVFTLVGDEKERQQFLDIIYDAVTDTRSRVRIIITIRADFYDKPLHYPEFGELMRSRMETILPLSAKELERAIAGPAERQHLVFEEGLVAHIISEINYHAGALPLLQYALTELFEYREGLLLTQEAYQKIGGAVGALAKRAETLYSEMDEQRQAITQQMFMRLVTLGEGAGDTRRRTNRAELLSLVDKPDVMDDVIDLFTSNRLLLLDRDLITRQPTVEVAHEAILSQWQRLRKWVGASRESIKMQQQLSHLTEEWLHGDKDDSFLLVGIRLEQFEQWLTENNTPLTPTEKAYIVASISHRDLRQQQEAQRQQQEEETQRQLVEKQQQSAQRLRLLVYALMVFLAGALVLSFVALNERNQAEIARQNESNARAVAEDSLQRTNAQRLGLEALSLAQTNGDPELIALLALRSVSNRYTSQGDYAIQAAILQQYPTMVLNTASLVGNRGLALSPEGTRLAVGGLDDSTTVWDLETGTQIGQFAIGDRVVFLPDGERIVTANRLGALRVWNIETGELLYSRDDLGEMYTRSMVFWGARNALVLASGDSELILLDVDTWQEQTRFQFTELPSNVWDLFVTHDGESLGVILGNRLSVLDATELELIGNYLAGDEIAQSGAISPDGRYVAVGTGAGKVWLWDAEDPETPLHVIDGVAEILDVAFSPDGEYILTSGSSTQVRFWDVATGLEYRSPLVHAHALATSIFSNDGQQIITAGQSPMVRIWDAVYQSPVPTHASVTAGNHHVFSSDGRYLAAVRMNELTIHDRETGTAAVYEQPGMMMATANTQDARYILVGSIYDAKIRFFDLASQAMLERTISTGGPVISIAVSQDNRYIAGAGWGPFNVWDFETGEVIFSDDLQNIHWNIDISPDNNYVLVSTDNVVRLYETTSWQTVWESSAEQSGIAKFSPDGRTFIIGGNDGILRLWDVETITPLREFSGHYGNVNTIDFSSDGAWLVSGSPDGTTRIWDVETGEEMRRFVNDTVTHVLFSPDGQDVLIDNSIDFTVWPVDISRNIGYLCQQITRDFTPQERLRYEIDEDIICEPYES